MKTKLLPLLVFINFATMAYANNVSLTNVSVANNLAGTGKVVQFDLSWENSWRTTSTGNFDGVWVFFKFKDLDGKWYPLRFNGNNITMPAGFTQDIGNNGAVTGIGVFIYRNTNGFGTSTLTGVKLGIQSYPGTFEVRGFALEMVYIPQGSFWLGDGSSEDAYQSSNVGNTPYQVTGQNNITPGTAAGNLYDPETVLTASFAGFPTGYNAFWIMKYELSQGGYRDFLNTLTFTQQVSRIASSPNAAVGTNIYSGGAGYRQYIEIATPGVSPSTPAVVGCDADGDNIYNESTDGEWITASTINWPDMAAYLDWSGLRPMSEFEYEKACRGPIAPVANEFAWGTDAIAAYAYTLTNTNTASESITNPSAVFGNAINDSSNINYARGGIFATATSTRVSSGASYYGVMELTGSAYEQVVGSGFLAGRSYTGKNGDGLLTTLGNANENFWPGVNGITGIAVSPGIYNGGDGVTSDGGTRDRGGNLYSTFDLLKVSHRGGYGTGNVFQTAKSAFKGIRGVRDAN